MKTSFVLLKVILLFCLLFQLPACNSLKNAVDRVNLNKVLDSAHLDERSKELGQNIVLGINDKIPLISQSLSKVIKSSVDTLDPEIKKILKTIDSIGTLSSLQINKIGDTLHTQLNRIKKDIEDEKLKKFFVKLLGELVENLDKKSRNILSNMVQNALNSLATDSSTKKINFIVDNVLNDSTTQKLQRLVSGALQPSVDSIFNKIDTAVHRDVPFIQREASKLLIGVGIIALCIIGFVWYQRMKYLKLVKILTYHIDKIPSQDIYDQLTQEIKMQAQKDSLEPLLRNTLKNQGINT